MLLLRRSGDVGSEADRRAKRLVVASVWFGLIAAFVLAKNVPALLAGAAPGRRCSSGPRSSVSEPPCAGGRS